MTGQYGTFVRSHLIPKALTRIPPLGVPFIQSGMNSRPVRRFDSWYDDHLVTRRGERILEALDSWAISELRKHKLVWSGWDKDQLQLGLIDTPLAENLGVRRVNGIDKEKLRLFFLSILWRAAATDRYEFSDVILSADDLEKLRLMLSNSHVNPLSFYPTQLIQLSTRGENHNFTPIKQEKIIPSFENEPEKHINIFRFYFDGLVVHFHRHSFDDGYTDSLGPLVVGADDLLYITVVPLEDSFQYANFTRLVLESYSRFPKEMEILDQSFGKDAN